MISSPAATMDVRCEKCLTVYEFDHRQAGAGGVTVKCAECGNLFKVKPRVETAELSLGAVRQRSAPTPPATAPSPPLSSPPPPAGASAGAAPADKMWMVRRTHSGEVLRFRELTTLQQWIVERKIAREDEISRSGDSWKVLGGIAELASFFQIVEQAAAAKRATAPEAAALAAQSNNPSSLGTSALSTELQYSDSDPSGPITLGTPVAGSEPVFTSTGSMQIVGVVDEDDRSALDARPRRVGLFAGLFALLSLALACGYLLLYRGDALRGLLFSEDGRGEAAYRQGREFFLLDSDDDFRQAAAAFERAHGADAQNALALGGLAEVHSTWAGYLFDEARAIGEAGRAAPSSAAATLQREGRAHLEEAKRFANEASALRPDAAAIHRAMADYLRVSDAPFVDVSRHLQRAMALLPNDPETLYVAGALAARENRMKEAEQQLERANQLNQAATQHGLLRASFLLARLQIAAGRTDDARRSLQSILTANGQHDRARALLRSLDMDAGVPKAVPMAPSPQAAPVLPTTGAAPTKVEPPEKRTADYHVFVAQADRLAENGHSKEARKIYEKALELSPKGLEALTGLAYCELDAEHFLVAVDHFKQALSIAPEYGEAIIGLAEAYKVRSDKAQAVEYYRRYLKILPHGPKASMAQKNLRDLEGRPNEVAEPEGGQKRESGSDPSLPRPPPVDEPSP